MGTEQTPRFRKIGDFAAEWDREAARNHELTSEGRPRGPRLAGLGRFHSDHLPVGLTVLLGDYDTRDARTAFTLQVAATCGCPALLVNTEREPVDVLRRIVARTANTAMHHLEGEDPPERMRELFTRAAREVPNIALVDATIQRIDPDQIHDAALDVRGQADHLLVVIDTLDAWARITWPDMGEKDALRTAIGHLQSLGRELRCSILGTMHRDLMEKGRFPYPADLVLEMDQGGSTGSYGGVSTTLKVIRSGRGDTGQTSLKWSPTFQHFTAI